MTQDESLHARSIQELASMLREGELTPVELAENTLARIKQLNPRLHAFNSVTAEAAMVQATQAGEELASGVDRGLHDSWFVRTVGGLGQARRARV